MSKPNRPQKNPDSELISWAKSNATPAEMDAWQAWVIQQNHQGEDFAIDGWPGLPKLFSRLKPFSARNITTFGEVAAEDDAVLKYFLTTPAVEKIDSGEVLLVLGRKGSGKTALVTYFTDSNKSVSSCALTLGEYPWQVHQQRSDSTVSEVEAYVASWRYLIAVQLAALLMKHPNIDMNTAEARSISEFFTANYGGLTPDLGDVLRPSALKLSKASFEPQILGNKLGSVSLERGNTNVGRELRALTDALLATIQAVGGACGINQLSLHFDELDRGLVTLDESRKDMLIGLVLAAREILRTTKSTPVRCSPIIYLRTDIWEKLKFSDKNKITQARALNLEWTPETLFDLVKERIHANINRHANWQLIASPNYMRGAQAKWDHILSRTFLRPRDVISFLNTALETAKRRNRNPEEPLVLENPDIVGARDAYSVYLKQELEDEIAPHWAHWEDALRACSAIATVTFSSEQFKREYKKKKSAGNGVSAEDALSMLYDFSVIGYEKRSGYGGTSWIFQYTNPEAGWDASATRLKVHVGLKEVAKLREERSSAGNAAETMEE